MKSFIIFVVLTICFVFNTKFLNASGFEDLLPLRNKSLALNEAGFIIFNMEQKHKGATSELMATVWLLKKGYEVFRNISNHGLIDIIAVNPETNKTIFIDVTTILKYKRPKGGINFSYPKRGNKEKILRQKNIKIMVVNIEANKVYWSDNKIFNRKPLKRISAKISNRAYILREKGLTYQEIELEIYGSKGGGSRAWAILNKCGN